MEDSSTRLILGDKPLRISDVFDFLRSQLFVEISGDALDRINSSRFFLEGEILKDKPIYGVNTGFGKLARERISAEEMEKLQLNLVRSHASGVGEFLPVDVVSLTMLLILNSFSRGRSGVRAVVAETLASLLNLDFRPVTPSIGSLGASGDLAPLSSIALALIGEGEVFTRGEPGLGLRGAEGWERLSASEALNRFGVEPLTLKAKEGLSLINSTAVTQAVLLLSLKNFASVLPALLIACAMSHEAFGAGDSHFDVRLAREKPHEFSSEVSRVMLDLRAGSELRKAHLGCDRVQDPYSFRCFVPVCSTLLATWKNLASALETEMNATSDNPLVFAEHGEVVSGGNFHAEMIANFAESAGLSLARSAMMSERRVNQLLHPSLDSGLPPFLVGDSAEAGLESGLMILQYVASALTAEINHLALPAILTNVSVSGDQEDFVSLSLTSANKLLKTSELFAKIVAIELIVALRGICARSQLASLPPYATSAHLKKVREIIESVIDVPEADSPFTERIELLSKALLDRELGLKFFATIGINCSPLLPWL